MTEQLPILRTEDEETIASLRAENAALKAKLEELNSSGPKLSDTQGGFLSALAPLAGEGDENTGTNSGMYHERDNCIECLREDKTALALKLESMMQDGEAVAWMNSHSFDKLLSTISCWTLVQKDADAGFDIPLFTHPLSVEEIEQRTAEACAKLCEDNADGHWTRGALACVDAIHSGKWREYL